MKQMIPVYILLLAILGVFALGVRELRGIRSELIDISREQMVSHAGEGVPVKITNTSPILVDKARER